MAIFVEGLSINIALIGYGKMGKIVETIAKKRGHTISAIVDPSEKNATHKAVSAEALKNADACIEFSLPTVALENIKAIAQLKKNHVVATTGWNEKLVDAKSAVQKAGTGFIYASNFSVGVSAFYRVVEAAAKAFNNLSDYDVFGYELHHNRKADSPSGTAKSIGEILLKNMQRKKKLVFEKLDRKIDASEIHIASVRGGDVPGTHSVQFDSSADTIELRHTARNREGFALGAVMAAEWLKGKKGFFTIEDMMKEVIR